MPNRLARESSPYLLQHRDNPVDWYPWGEEALARARSEDKPILVSIGYSACHWCHVMAHECFENESIADLMNRSFVNVKVDREERPDIDSIYMTALQAMSGQGGWPLNVFLTPEGVPFFGGTYWPPADRRGMPGFPKVLAAIHRAWLGERAALLRTAGQVHGYLAASAGAAQPGDVANEAVAETAVAKLHAQFDRDWGGFGQAPKFPQASVIEFLLRHHRRTGSDVALEMATFTLDRMAAGGIHDQIGGGFARYAVDREWLVPHFEKMLYDNAQLMRLYVDAWRLTGRDAYRTVVEEIAAWLLREMRSPEGGFYAALDADSEGVEGKFYVWTIAEIDGALDPDEADLVRLHYGVSPVGNFEGQSILQIARPLADLAASSGEPVESLERRLAAAREKLLAVRETRVRPGTDTKVIVSWNGLAIGALATAGAALGRPDLVVAARTAASHIVDAGLREPDRLVRTLTGGQPAGDGMLEDYVFLADGLLALYTATGEHRWLEHAATLAQAVLDRFGHSKGPGFFDTSVEHERLIIRPRELQDGAIPCGNSVAIDVLLTLAQLREAPRYGDQIESLLSALATPMAEHPAAFGRFLAVLERTLADQRQVVLAGGAAASPLQTAITARYEPFLTLAHAVNDAHAERWPTLGHRPVPAGAPAAAYLCQGMSCLPPISSPAGLIDQLDRMAN